MKRTLLLFSALMLSCIALWAVEIGGIYYNLNDDKKTAEVTYYGKYYYSVHDEYSGSVTIPETITYNSKTYSVTSIGSLAFRDCSGLTSVTIPNSVTSIGPWAFYGCSGLTEVTIPNSVTSIGSLAFDSCSGLTSVTIPNSVTSIDEYAFSGCSGLTSVTIPNSVTSIGKDAFYICSGLTSVIWNAKNCKDFELFHQTPFYETGSNITSFTFGNEVEHIPAYLCYKMSKLSEVTIPNSVTSIGYEAFYGCSGLTSVTIPNSVTTIGSGAFKNCSGLTSVIWNAKNYKDFSSSSYAPFYDIRSSITSFTFGNEVEYIPEYLCYDMENLKEVTIGEGVTSIGDWSFSDCSGLTKVNYLGTVDKWVEIDFHGSSSNPIYYAEKLYINSELLTNVKITEADSIKNYAFYNCQSINSVEIGNSVTSIGEYAFSGCSGLTSVTIPNSVTSIGDGAFSSCSRLTSVIWNAKNCADFEYNSYYNTCKSPFYNIRSNITSFTFGNEVEHIPAYLCYYMNNLKEVTIGKSVTSIGSSAFSGCSGLTEVTIPNSVTSIGKGAFSGCRGLTSVTIPNSVTSIGEEVFSSCSGLTSVTIPTSVTSIGKGAFSGCSRLTSVTIPTSVTSIGYEAFFGCSGLTSVTIPNSVTTIGSGAFKNCSGLKSVSIGESVNTVGSGAFAGCDNLKKITMYPMNVPNMEGTDIFAHYNAYLYVPCAVYEDYDLDDVFGNFKYIKCIAATEVEGSDKVEIEVDENNNATIVWPFVDSASSYKLVISKDGVVFCTLIFNENGQLTSIDFGNRAASVGFQFTVTGLEEASKYDYVIEAKDKVGNVLKSYKGTFTTNGYNSDTAILETLADANITVSGGMISADKEFSIYNTLGKDVTALNGSLLPGIYVITLDEDRVKVMVK